MQPVAEQPGTKTLGELPQLSSTPAEPLAVGVSPVDVPEIATSTERVPTRSDRSLLNEAERLSNPGAYISVDGAGVVARSGDNISRMLGTSDPQAIGNFMRANNLTSDRIEAGRNYFRPDSTTAYGDASDLGQFALNQGNERIAAASRGEMQRELNRFAALSGPETGAPVWNMRDASAAAMRGHSSSGNFYSSLAEGASNAQYVSAMLDAGMDAGGKAAGAAKLLPAGALQQARVEALMAAKDLQAAQGLIKGPTAKSAFAMAEYGTKYAGAFKALPYLGATLSVAEEANRVYRADGWQETTKVVAVGTGNYFADGAVTTGGAWTGAKAGAAGGAIVGSFIPFVGTGAGAVVGGLVGAIGGAVGGHWLYDTYVATEVRAQVIGEKFRDGN